METKKRKLAVGWFDNAPFKSVCEPYIRHIKEVFFAWPGVTACRPMDPWTPMRRERIIDDLKWSRANGIELDAIFNALCYGDNSISDALADHIETVLGEMAAAGLFPEHITTASPFIAVVIRQRFPAIKIRFSVNVEFPGTTALESVDELFDLVYADPNQHRRVDYLEHLNGWATAHGKTVGIYANSGCLRHCPFHVFHNNLHGHNRCRQSAEGEKYGFSVFRCRTNYERGNFEDFLRAVWIRPEELPRCEPFVSVIKLSTRRHPDPAAVIRAYATCRHHGDIAKILDPFFEFPKAVDNSALGASSLWPEVRDCINADNCTRCGKCAALLSEVFKDRKQVSADVAEAFRKFFNG